MTANELSERIVKGHAEMYPNGCHDPNCGNCRKPSTVIEYTISLTVTRPVGGWTCDETAEEHEDAAEWMQSKDAKRELEREVLQALRKLDGDCDCEVMDVQRKADDVKETR